MEGAFRISKNAVTTCLREGIIRQKLHRTAAGKMGMKMKLNEFICICNYDHGPCKWIIILIPHSRFD